MSLLKALKYVDEHYDEINKNTREFITIPCTKMLDMIFYHYKYSYMQIRWQHPLDKYCMLFELSGDDGFVYNTIDLNNPNCWNSDLSIEYNVERSYFDCLNTIYPMSSNFKFEHIAVLQRIDQQFKEKDKKVSK